MGRNSLLYTQSSGARLTEDRHPKLTLLALASGKYGCAAVSRQLRTTVGNPYKDKTSGTRAYEFQPTGSSINGFPAMASPATPPSPADESQTRILRPAKDASDRPLGKLTTLEHSEDHTPNMW